MSTYNLNIFLQAHYIKHRKWGTFLLFCVDPPTVSANPRALFEGNFAVSYHLLLDSKQGSTMKVKGSRFLYL